MMAMNMQMQMKEQQRQQTEFFEMMKKQNRKGGNDMWEVDYEEKYNTEKVSDEKELMGDKAKSYSF